MASNDNENVESFDGVFRPRAASHPVSAPSTPSRTRKNVELMPPPLATKTPSRQRQGIGSISLLVCGAPNIVLYVMFWEHFPNKPK